MVRKILAFGAFLVQSIESPSHIMLSTNWASSSNAASFDVNRSLIASKIKALA